MTNKIWAGPADGANHKPLTVEGVALAADILPGNSVAIEATGINNSANDGTTASRILIAREVGEQFGATITTPWTNAENMVAISPRSGEFVYVNMAASAALDQGAGITDNGAGLFKAAGAGDVAKLYLAEAKPLTAAASLVLAYKE